MGTLAIVSNPRRRRKGRKSRKAKRSPRRARIVRRRKRRAARALFANPKRRKTRRSGKRRSRGLSLRGLSVGGLVGNAKSLVKSAAPAAVGALALDVIWGYLPLPASVRTGYVRHVAKAAGAVALGMVAEKVVGRDVGGKFALGAMTVVLYNLAKDVLAQFAPGIALAGDFEQFPDAMGYTSSAMIAGGDYGNDPLMAPALNEYQGVGEYQTVNAMYS